MHATRDERPEGNEGQKPGGDASPRAEAWEWAQAALLGANLTWLAFQLGGRRPEPMPVSVALTSAMLAAHFLGRAAARDAVPTHPAGWWFTPFLIAAAVNSTWVTPVRWLGWFDWMNWAQLAAVFWVALNGLRARATRAALLGVLAALAVAQVAIGGWQVVAAPTWIPGGRPQHFGLVGRASGGLGLPNGLAGLLLLLLPAAGALAWRRGATRRERIGFGALAAWLLAGLVLTVSRGAWLALAAVLVAWPLLAAGGTAGRRVARAFAVLGAVAGLGLALWATMPLVRERMAQFVVNRGEVTRPWMWRGAWKIFREHPALGGGAGSYVPRFEAHRPEQFKDDPLNVHNDYLQTLAEHGVAGFALLFGAAAFAAWRLARAARPAGESPRETALAGGLTAGAAAWAVQLGVEYHLKVPGVGLAFAAVAGVLVARAWPAGAVRASPRWARAGTAGGALLAVLGGLGLAVPGYRAEVWRLGARERIDSLSERPLPAETRHAVLRAAATDLARATEIDPRNAAAWAGRAYVAALLSREEPGRARELGREAEAAARRALAGGKIVSEHWIRLGVALDVQGRWPEAGDAFAEALLLAPASALAWFHHAYHLSLNRATLAEARAAVAICLRLDPSQRDGDALRRNLTAPRRE